jgi:thioesterase domain-containing protein
VEERFQLTVDDEDLSREMFRSFARFHNYVQQRVLHATGNSQATPPLLHEWPPCVKTLVATGAKQPAFLVPGGSGGLAELNLYRRIAQRLKCNRPIYQFMAQGLEDNVPPHNTVAEIAEFFGKAIQTMRPQGPIILLGECVGGAVAFELAQRLRAAGRELALLLVVDGWVPAHIPPVWLQTTAFGSLARRIRLMAHHKALGQIRQTLGHSDSKPDAGEIGRIESVGHAYHQAAFRYQPSYYPGPMTLISSEESAAIDPTLGWSKLVANLQTHCVRGDHESYLREHSGSLVARVRSCLASVD